MTETKITSALGSESRRNFMRKLFFASVVAIPVVAQAMEGNGNPRSQTPPKTPPKAPPKQPKKPPLVK